MWSDVIRFGLREDRPLGWSLIGAALFITSVSFLLASI